MRRKGAFVKVALAWAVLNAAIIAAWPVPGASVKRALLAGEVAALVAGAVAVGVGYRRAWSWPHVAVLWLGVVEIAVVTVGPFRSSVYARWELAQVAYSLGFAVLAVVHAIAAHRLRRGGS